ncbi:MAG: DUF2339 domain-containing protein [Polyangiaceae bacterium]|nr:DUF2339 domain-containing protein [Polyangiaceae bacterium]
MDFLLGPVGLLLGGVFVLWFFTSRERDRARLKRVEESIAQLFSAGYGVAQRVSVLETRASLAPSSAYRTSVPSPEPAPIREEARVSPPIPAPIAEAASYSVAATLPAPLPAFAPRPPSTPRPMPLPERASPPPPRPPRSEAPAHAAEEPALPEEPSATIDWERWIGVRGAAALGAGILVIALIYFLRYTIAVGWLTLELRVGLGALVGMACVAVAQLRFRTTHRVLASWLTGAGVAGLYVSIWAAQHIAGLIGPPAAFGLAVLVTGACTALALRDDSLPIAWLGMAGGFAAPMALNIDGTKPYGVVAYLLVLDVAMVVLAARKRWWSLSALAMLFTATYEAVWVATQSHAEMLALQVGVLTIFAGVFGAVPSIALGDPQKVEETPAPLARLTRFGAVLVPFAIAAWLTQDPAVVRSPLPIGALLVLLTVMSAVIAWRQREAALPLLAAIGAPGVIAAWLYHVDSPDYAMSLAALLIALAIPHGALVWAEAKKRALGEGARTDVREIANAGAVLFLVAAMSLVLGAVTAQPGPWGVYLMTEVVLAAAMIGLARIGAMHALASVASVGLAIASLVIGGLHSSLSDPVNGGDAPFAGSFLCILAFAALHVLGRRTDAEERRELLIAARRGSLVALAGLTVYTTSLSLGIYACLAVALATSAIAARDERGTTYPLAGAILAFAMLFFTWVGSGGHEHSTAYVIAALAAFVLAAPLARPLDLLGSVWVPRGQVIIMAAFGLVIAPRWLLERPEHLGAGAAVGAAASLGLLLAMKRLATADEVRREAGITLGSTSIALTTAAIALCLDNEHMTWGFAAFGALLTYLAIKNRNFALAIVGVVHVVGACLRVAANPAALSYHERSTIPVFNWVAPTFLIPALAAGFVWYLIGTVREPTGEKSELRYVPAIAGLATTFAWLNVAVLDAFSAGATISFDTHSPQARDLMMSFAWALYGLGLLVLGMRRRVTSLRWTSLVLILLTAGKVFLYDLSQLQDLYRVASLAGLAISLLGISLLYQRFVFRAERASIVA